MPEWLKRLLDSLEGMITDDQKEAFEEAKQAAEEAAESQSATGTDDPAPDGDVGAAVQAALAPMQQQIDALTASLSEEQQARKSAQEAMKKKQKQERQEEIESLVEKAVKDGRIEKEKRETWTQRLEDSFDVTKGVLADLSAPNAVNAEGGSPTGNEGDTDAVSTTGSRLKPGYAEYVSAATGASAGD